MIEIEVVRDEIERLRAYEQDDTADMLDAAIQEIDRLKSIIDNARMAFAETQTDDETRCRAMAAALSDVDEA